MTAAPRPRPSPPAGQRPGQRVVPLTEVTGSYAVNLGTGGVLLTSPGVVRDVLQAVEGSVRAQRSSGLPIPERIASLVDALRLYLADATEAASGSGRADVRLASLRAGWQATEWIGAREAAALLGTTDRQARRLAAEGRIPGGKHGRSWLLDRAAVLEAARERREDEDA